MDGVCPKIWSYLSTLGQSSISGKRVKVKHNSFSVPFKIWMVVFQDMFFVIHTMGPTATSSVLKYTSVWPQLPCLTLLTFPCSTVLYLAPNNLAQAWPGLLDPLLCQFSGQRMCHLHLPQGNNERLNVRFFFSIKSN